MYKSSLFGATFNAKALVNEWLQLEFVLLAKCWMKTFNKKTQ